MCLSINICLGFGIIWGGNDAARVHCPFKEKMKTSITFSQRIWKEQTVGASATRWLKTELLASHIKKGRSYRAGLPRAAWRSITGWRWQSFALWFIKTGGVKQKACGFLFGTNNPIGALFWSALGSRCRPVILPVEEAHFVYLADICSCQKDLCLFTVLWNTGLVQVW